MHTLVHEPSQFVLGNQIVAAETFWSRLVGLMLRRNLLPGTGLFLPNCSSVHTIGMRCVIDLIFLDAHFAITAIRTGAKPFRIFFGPRGSKHVLELPAGTLQNIALKPGDRLLKT